MLADACLRGVGLHAELGRPVRMSVNVSARQLQHPDFVEHVEQALESSGFPAACLTLELTETVLLSSGDRVEQQLKALKEMGICSRSTTSAPATRRWRICGACPSTS